MLLKEPTKFTESESRTLNLLRRFSVGVNTISAAGGWFTCNLLAKNLHISESVVMDSLHLLENKGLVTHRRKRVKGGSVIGNGGSGGWEWSLT